MASELEVGGVSSTTAKLGSSAGSAHGDADDLIIGNGSSTNAGITFNTPSAGGYLYFADGSSGDDFYRGFIKYVHSGNAMEFGTNAVSRLSISSTGRVDTVANNNGDWSFKSQNTHASGFGALIIAGGSTASQTAFEVRHTGNTGSGTSALKIDGTGGIQIGADGTARELRWGNTFANNGPTIIGHDVNGTLQFYPAGNGSGEAMKLASDKLATFSNGITVNGAVGSFANGIYFSSQTGAASPASTSTSVLNHYEEGTWTPSVGGDATYSAQTGRYTRIGRLVTATFDLTINVIGTGSTYIVSGLPFNSASGESIGAGGNINYYASLAVSPVLFAPTVAGSTVHIRSATSAASSPSNHGLLGNAARIAGIVTYTV